MVPFRVRTDSSALCTVSTDESRSVRSCRKITDVPEVISRERVFSQLTRPERLESDERPPDRERLFISRMSLSVDRNLPLADTVPQRSTLPVIAMSKPF